MARAERREGHTVNEDSPGVGSGTFTPDAFNQLITDSSAFSLTIDSGTRNAIQWIAAKDAILIGTTGGEWTLDGHTRTKPITPTSFSIRQHTNHGSADLQPVLLDDAFAFINYVGRKLYKLEYDGIDENYITPELSLLAEHITESGIVGMAYQRNPDSILWSFREDGTLVSKTYDPRQDVVAWARHFMGSSDTVSETRPTVSTNYPLLRPTTNQDDLGLPAGTLIRNVEDLQAMTDNRSGSYSLANDIDALDTVNWNSGAGFLPVGNIVTKFTGTFDGKGFTISDLFVNRTSNYNGLFGFAEGKARIANVTMANVDITGDDFTAGLVGEISATSTDEPIVQNCSSSGAIKARASQSPLRLAGLVGESDGDVANDKTVFIYDSNSSCTVSENSALITTHYGGFIGTALFATIQNCFATGDVDGTDTTSVGGFVGEAIQGTTISFCYATGNVIADATAGGFVGSNANASGTGSITKCYATGNVTNTEAGADNFGGFVGSSAGGDITDCYAWGNISSDQTGAEVGGFVGEDTSGNATFTNCYSIGLVTGESTPGGFIGNGSSNTFTDDYWDTDTSGTTTSDGGTGRGTTSMKTEGDYASGWDFDTIWYMLPLVQATVQAVRTESVAVIPSTTEDEVWATVNRTVNGSPVRYIERMKPRDWGDDMEDMFFVDSGLTYDGVATTTITGLDHLEGETVAILADGAIQSSKVVSSGSITLDDAASVVQVGLPYRYKLKPMRLDQNTSAGTSKGSIKKITEVVVSFFETLLAHYSDGTDILDWDWRETDAEYTTPPDLVSGDKVAVADGGFDVEDSFQIEGDEPMPCSVRAIIPRIEKTGR